MDELVREMSHSLQRALHVRSYRDENIWELRTLAGGEQGPEREREER